MKMKGLVFVDIVNHMELSDRQPWYKRFMFVDLKDYMAEQAFASVEGLRVRMDKIEGSRPEDDYVVRFCRVRKGDEGLFGRAMEELGRNILLSGHRRYGDYCRDLFEGLDEED